MSETKSCSILEKIRDNKTLQRIIVAVFIVIVIAIFLVSTFAANNEEVEDVAVANSYVSELEDRLSTTLSKVEGAGEVSIVITVESGMETVLATKTITTQTDNGVEITETPILVNGKTVVLKENYPKIVGVLIVAEGAKSISVLSRIQQATVSLLDIDINQIEILTMK